MIYCVQVKFAIQCDICQNRKPVRFGKRGSPPEINAHVKKAAAHLMYLLLRRAAEYTQDDADDSTIHFQLTYK